MNAVELVWAKYKTYHRRARLTPDRRKVIQARLNEGFAIDDLLDAIDGIHKIPHNMGQNDRGRTYLDIELIMRSAKHVEGYAEAWDMYQARISRKKQARQGDADEERRFQELRQLKYGGER